MDAHILVPLKRLDRAKSRLATALPPAERATLMLDLLDGVVAAIRAAGVQQITLVTAEEVVHEAAGTWYDHQLPWNEALSRAADEVAAADHVAVVSADLPFLQPSDVKALLEQTPRNGVVVARALDGGTNAVSMRPRGVLPTRFGETASARLHEESARRRQLECVILDRPGLAFDVDTPEDLARMRLVREGAA